MLSSPSCKKDCESSVQNGRHSRRVERIQIDERASRIPALLHTELHGHGSLVGADLSDAHMELESFTRRYISLCRFETGEYNGLMAVHIRRIVLMLPFRSRLTIVWTRELENLYFKK